MLKQKIFLCKQKMLNNKQVFFIINTFELTIRIIEFGELNEKY
jgi:hypothetical protein